MQLSECFSASTAMAQVFTDVRPFFFRHVLSEIQLIETVR